jgi:hypothetical protein
MIECFNLLSTEEQVMTMRDPRDKPKDKKGKDKVPRRYQHQHAKREHTLSQSLKISKLVQVLNNVRKADDQCLVAAIDLWEMEAASPLPFIAVVELLWSTDSRTRSRAFQTLASRGLIDERTGSVSAIIKELVDVFEHGTDYKIRERAAAVIGKYGPKAKEAVPVLVRMLWQDDLDLNIWVMAVNLLRWIGPEAREGGASLFQFTKDTNERRKKCASDALRVILGLPKTNLDFSNYSTYADLMNFVDTQESPAQPQQDFPLPAPPAPTAKPVEQNLNTFILVDQQTGQGRPVPEVDNHKVYSHLDSAIETVPKNASYDEQATQIEGLIGGVRQRAAARLLPPLKEEMRRRPHNTYDQKIEMVAWVNAELRRFNLAIKHPKTGLPATFKPKPGNDPEIGCFQLSSEDADGKEKTFTTPDLATLLDKLELIDAAARREALSEWREKVGRQHRGAKRG